MLLRKLIFESDFFWISKILSGLNPPVVSKNKTLPPFFIELIDNCNNS